MKRHLCLLLLGVICAFALSSCETRTRHDSDFEGMVELLSAIQAYEKEFGGMGAMHPNEMMLSLSGKNPRSIRFLDFERNGSSVRFIDGQFVSRSGRGIAVFFSPEKILLAVTDSADDTSGMIHKRELKSIVVRRQ